jgi:FMN-binding protein
MRRVILAIVATAAALAFLLSFKTRPLSPGTAPAPAPGSDTGTSGGAPGAGTGSAPAGGGPGKTVTGAAWPTVYGPVQVRITVAAGRITAVTALKYPTGTPEDEQINAYAIPQLNKEALAAGSAKIDTVSGATYTSGGYIGSLQSALDRAGSA